MKKHIYDEKNGLSYTEVWPSVYDIRELLDSSVVLMDGKSPLEVDLGLFNILKKPLIALIKGTVIEKLLYDHRILKDGMRGYKKEHSK